MNKIKIIPSKLSGTVKIPPSKSMAHRAIICASLSEGVSTISGVDYSEDIIATIDGMKSLGATIEQSGDTLTICGKNLLHNTNDTHCDIFCNESGSTLRFLVPISIISDKSVRFTGKGNLGKRPLTPFYEIFDKQGIEYSYVDNILDLQINGHLTADTFELAGNISSQFITGLLFSLPLLEHNSTIKITTPLESRGYIDLTLQMMERFGIKIQNNNYESFEILGNQQYKHCHYQVEGDFSQAAFFLVAGAIGNDITCSDMNINSLQGDKQAIEFLKEMGAEILIENNTLKAIASNLNEIVMDGSECPDIIPVMTVAGALSCGNPEVINAVRLRIKECDRLMAISTELNKLGAIIQEEAEGLKLTAVKEFKGNCTVSSHEDHRIAMSLAIAATRCEQPIILEHPECVSKSYPSFWKDYVALGGKIEEVQ